MSNVDQGKSLSIDTDIARMRAGVDRFMSCVSEHGSNVMAEKSRVDSLSAYYDSCPRAYEGCGGSKDFNRFEDMCSQNFHRCSKYRESMR